MSVLSFRTSTYARNVYIYGTTKLADIPVEYYVPVEQYAATNFRLDQIDNALAQGWITQQEYDETLSYRPPSI